MKAFLLIALVTMGTKSVWAQDSTASTSSVRAQDVAPVNIQELPQADIDKEITNAKMRASLGSKSRWSVKSTFTYNGGTIDRPGSDVRPDYVYATDPSRATPDLTSLSAAIGVKYSLSARSGLTLGTGLQVNNPLQTTTLNEPTFTDPRPQYKGRQVKRSEVQNPYVEYTYAAKALGLQWVTDTTYSFYTSDISKNIAGGFGSLTFQEIAMKEAGNWTLGVAFAAVVPQWDKEPAIPQFVQYEWDAAVSPFVEYAFNDRYSFRTVFNWVDVLHEPGMTFGQEPAGTPAQSVGLGIAVTRDLYFYPNVQFVPWDVRSDRTNVAVQANVNLF